MLGRFGLKAGRGDGQGTVGGGIRGRHGPFQPAAPRPLGRLHRGAGSLPRRAARPGGRSRDGLEVDGESLDLVTFYSRNLAVPERRDVDDPQVLRGKAGVLRELAVPACHTPKFVTHRLKDQPEQSFQLIWPYTDLLLHDMGEALADNRPEGRATGREWTHPAALGDRADRDGQRAYPLPA